LYSTKDLDANALQHGMYYIYLLQPLVVADNVPSSCEFNVFISLDVDFTFAGYGTDFLNGSPTTVVSLTPPSNVLLSRDQMANMTMWDPEVKGLPILTLVNDFHLDPIRATLFLKPVEGLVSVSYFPVNRFHTIASHAKIFVPYNEFTFVDAVSRYQQKPLDGSSPTVAQSGAINPMNEPDDQADLLPSSASVTGSFSEIMRPIVSVRDLIRRMQYVDTIPLNTGFGSDCTIIPLSGYLGQFQVDQDGNPYTWNSCMAIQQMFYGKNIGLKMKLKLWGVSNAIIRYIPPGIAYDDDREKIVKLISPANLLLSNGSDASGFVGGYNVVEEPQHFTVNPYSAVVATRSAYSDQVATAIYEFVIPNVSIFDFYGSDFSRFTSDANEIGNYRPSGDFGSLLINLPSFTSDTVYPPICTASVYMGLTDETRLGFQVLAPIFSIPTATLPTGTGLSSVQLVSRANLVDVSPQNVYKTSTFAYYTNLNTVLM
jgi:hypothetical protein